MHFSNSREPQAKLYPISYIYDIYFYIHVSIFIYSSICLSMYLLIYCHFYRLCLCVYLWIHMFSFSLLCFNLYLWLHSSISSDNILHKKCSLYIVRVEKKTWQRYNHYSVGLWWLEYIGLWWKKTKAVEDFLKLFEITLMCRLIRSPSNLDGFNWVKFLCFLWYLTLVFIETSRQETCFSATGMLPWFPTVASH